MTKTAGFENAFALLILKPVASELRREEPEQQLFMLQKCGDERGHRADLDELIAQRMRENRNYLEVDGMALLGFGPNYPQHNWRSGLVEATSTQIIDQKIHTIADKPEEIIAGQSLRKYKVLARCRLYPAFLAAQRSGPSQRFRCACRRQALSNTGIL